MRVRSIYMAYLTGDKGVASGDQHFLLQARCQEQGPRSGHTAQLQCGEVTTQHRNELDACQLAQGLWLAQVHVREAVLQQKVCSLRHKSSHLMMVAGSNMQWEHVHQLSACRAGIWDCKIFRSTEANAHIPQGRVTSTLKHRQAHLSPLRGRQAGHDQLPGAQAGANSGWAELARARGVLQAGLQ